MPYADKIQRKGSQLTANLNSQKQGVSGLALPYVDKRPKTEALKKLQEEIDKSARLAQPENFQSGELNLLERLDNYGIQTPLQALEHKQSLLPFLKESIKVDLLDEKGNKVLNKDGTAVKVDALQLENSVMPSYINAYEIYHSEFKPEIELIGRRVNAESKVAPFKEQFRAKEKITTDYGGYGGEVNQLVDIIRGSIICKTADQAVEAYKDIEKTFSIVRVKNRFKNPVNGYRDMLMNVKLSNGHIAEIQIHLEDIINIKEGEGHKLYASVRPLETSINNKTATPAEQAKWDQANAEMKRLYDKAWEKAKAIPNK
jgi:hypothetical protein